MSYTISKQKGDVAEAKVLAELLVRDYAVCLPFGDRLPYDLVVDLLNGKFCRIQVKSCFSPSSFAKAYKRRYYSKGIQTKEYSANDFDILVVWSALLDQYFVIPIKDFLERKAFNPNLAYAKDYRDRWDFIAAI